MERRRKAADLLLAAEREYYSAMRDDRADDTARLRRVQARAALERAEREAERVLAESTRVGPAAW